MEALDRTLIEALKHLDSCTVANAIETFEVRLRNEGFADSRVRALFDDRPPVVGRAATIRVRSSTPPPVGHNYVDRTDWWSHLLSVPAPRILVVQDIDERPGLGALVGEVHANVLAALGCVAYATNGAVRDLSGIRRTGLQIFAGSVAVSHAFVHIVDVGEPAEIGGLVVRPGDILHGDCHGLLSIPETIVHDVPPVACRMRAREHQVIELCRSPQFSIERLRTMVKGWDAHDEEKS